MRQVGKDDEPIKVGLQRIKEFKQVKEGDRYVPTSETREFNSINKFFDPKTGKTSLEVSAETEAVFIEQWKKRWEGELLDRTVGKNPAGTGSAKVDNKEKKVTKKLFT